MRRGNTGATTPAPSCDAAPEEPPTLHSDSDSDDEDENNCSAEVMAAACAGVWDEDRDEEEDDGRCARSTLTWRVPHFAALREEDAPVVLSEPQRTGEAEWRVKLFPFGLQKKKKRKRPSLGCWATPLGSAPPAPDSTDTPAPAPDQSTGTTDSRGPVGLFVEVCNGDALGPLWAVRARFRLELANALHPNETCAHVAEHTFTASEADWGYRRFTTRDVLLDPARGFVGAEAGSGEGEDDGALTVVASFVVLPDVPSVSKRRHTDYRARTGYVGIENRAATCYMNSLLQTLYHTTAFARAVLEIPTENDVPTTSVPLALQRLFFTLRFSQRAASTTELIRSFGWDAADAFQQHDAQELNRVLVDYLEEKMRGTPAEGALARLLSGQLQHTITCTQVAYTSTRRERFYDIALDVRGCRDVYESLERLTQPETLDGDNIYHAEGLGPQPARTETRLWELPPVLTLQLKRWVYDSLEGTPSKVDDLYHFPLELDLDRFVADGAPHPHGNVYELRAVLVHVGDGVGGGHYYVYIKPGGQRLTRAQRLQLQRILTKKRRESGAMTDTPPPVAKDEEDKEKEQQEQQHQGGSIREHWFRFDDEAVSRVAFRTVLEDAVGGNKTFEYREGEKAVMAFARPHSSAYMLVYVRRAEAGSVMYRLRPRDVPLHLHTRFATDVALAAQSERARVEAASTVVLYLVREQHLRAYENDKDLVDMDTVEAAQRVRRDTPLAAVYEAAAAHCGTDAAHIRLYTFVHRQNGTYRPSDLLPSAGAMIGQFQSGQGRVTLLVEELERSVPRALQPPAPPRQARVDNSTALLFFKHYDPRAGLLTYLGAAHFRPGDRVARVAACMRALAGLAPTCPVALYEEVRFDRMLILSVAPEQTVRDADLGTGDILVLQEVLDAAEARCCAHPTVKSFFMHTVNLVTVRLVPLAARRGAEGFAVRLPRTTPFAAVQQAVAQRLGVVAAHVRLTGHDSRIGQPLPEPFLVQHDPPCLGAMLSAGGGVGCSGGAGAAENTMTNSTKSTSSSIISSRREHVLHYEVLDIPVEQAEQACEIRVRFYDSRAVPAAEAQVLRVGRDGTVADVLRALPALLAGRCAAGARLRLLEVYDSRIARDFAPSTPITALQPARAQEYRVEEKGADELALDPATHARVQAVHFTRDATGNASFFGEPVYVVVPLGAPLAAVRPLLQRRLGVPDADFARWRFARITYTRPEMLTPDSIVVPARPAAAAAAAPSTGAVPSTLLGMLHPRPHTGRHHQHPDTGVQIRLS